VVPANTCQVVFNHPVTVFTIWKYWHHNRCSSDGTKTYLTGNVIQAFFHDQYGMLQTITLVN